MEIKEQDRVLENDKKNMLVSASAGSGKTYIMIKYITQLICEKKVPIKDFLVLTFTKAAATEMKERLQKRLKEQGQDDFVVEQIDALSTANISTIHAFCEKCIKKYANLLEISENFEIADENLSQKIRQTAFVNAFLKFQESYVNESEELLSFYKNDKNKIKNILLEIEVLVNSLANKEDFFNQNLLDSQGLFEKSVSYLCDNYKDKLSEYLTQVEKLHVDDFEFELKKTLSKILDCKDIFEMTNLANDFAFPKLPKRKEVGDEIVENLKALKTNINKIISTIKELNLIDDAVVEFQKNGILEKNILKLYDFYEKSQEKLKKAKNLLDFYDLEKYMKILSEKENLFDGIKYVFVDEYQDTNKVQERIVKNVAKNCNFVAVGDLKQGIYGFRLASSEIFLKDLKEFEEDENSAVNYLKSNFRSSQKVLDFVNDVFKVCMTQEVAGVDYENTSMLNGMANFVDDGQKAITLDLVKENETEVCELPELYSVKDAKVYTEEKNKNMLYAVAKRIVEVLQTKISDNGVLRACKLSDIAILSRKRDGLFNELEMFLQKIGLAVVSTSRNLLMDEPEIIMLKNYLKIALNLDDDVALLSVLFSGLCDISLQEILDEKMTSDASLCEIVLQSKNEKIIKFLENLQKFRKNILIFGAKKAFFELFDETNYRAFINLKTNAQRLNVFVDKFLEEISSSGLEFDLPALIKHFESVDISVVAEASAVEDAILLTTIHNSKGLEYPIVFLLGCDQSLKKGRPKIDVEINENFGLALKYFDRENNNEIISAKMRTIKEIESQKDFVEELMIFYVALTRAKNRIYLFGKQDEYKKFSVKDCDCYYDLIFYALQKDAQPFEDENLQICLLEDFDEDFSPVQDMSKSEILPDFLEKLKNYLSFEYKFDELVNFKLKESVTSLNQKNLEDKLVKYSNENFAFGGAGVEIGNAYHLALKTLDFEKIKDLKSLDDEILKNEEVFSKILPLVDKEVLLKNILILKRFCVGAKVFKEKEFVLKDSLKNLFDNAEFDDKILVQGVIDFFAIKDGQGVLIDYKYSNSNNDNYLLNKYIYQLKTYKIALEKALKIKINKVYLLSLKNNKLIKAEI